MGRSGSYNSGAANRQLVLAKLLLLPGGHFDVEHFPLPAKISSVAVGFGHAAHPVVAALLQFTK